jgi:hypothetical protein
MCSSINECDGFGLPGFDPCSAGIIREYAENHGCFDIPSMTVWVNFSYVGPEDGSPARPFNTLAEALAVVPLNGTISFFPGVSSETGIIDRSVILQSPLGTVTIGE